MKHWGVVSALLVTAACAESPVTSDTPTAPSVLVPNANYSGEWAGGWRTTSCVDLQTDFRYCAGNVRHDFEPIRLNLTQTGPRIVGTIQTRWGGGSVAGVVDALGRLRIGGVVMSVAARGVPSVPRSRIVQWRTVSMAGGYMIGGFTLEHLRANLNDPVAAAVAEFTDTLLKKCAGPKFTGVFWEC